MKRVLCLMAALAALLLCVLNGSSTAQYGKEKPRLEADGTPGLIITPVREWYGMVADFDAIVGTSVTHYAFSVRCEGAASTSIDYTHDNPQFEPIRPNWHSDGVLCGSSYLFSFTFSPITSGLTMDTVRFSSDLGNATEQLIGNGIPSPTPELWYEDLGAGSSAERLVYDGQRDLLYITDSGNGNVIVFSPAARAISTTVPVGADPVGLAMAPSNEELYVANSGEHSLSVIDLESLTESRIPVPSLYPDPKQDYHYWYLPYEVAVVSSTLALLGSRPPGLASGGPLYELDLETLELAPRTDLGGGRHSVFRTSRDLSVTGIVGEPGSSPTYVSRYDPATDSAIGTELGMERSIALDHDGEQIIVTGYVANKLQPELRVLDENLSPLGRIQLVGTMAVAAVFNPVAHNRAYAVNRINGYVGVARVDLMRQTKLIIPQLPGGFVPAEHAAVLSDDGMWLFMLIVENSMTDPSSSKVVGIRVESDLVPPSSAMNPLSPTQSHNWWLVSWHGTDDLSGIDYYEIQYREGPEGDWSDWLNTRGTARFFSGATPGQTYYFRCRAVDKSGNVEVYPPDFDTFTVAGDDPSGLERVYIPIVSRQ